MKLLAALGFGLLLAAVGFVYWSSRPASARAYDDSTLMVDDLRAGPKRFLGRTAEVSGVVGSANPDRGLFGLIDAREVQECGTIHCPEFVLPVEWTGELPAPGETVSVMGEVRRTGEGLMFVASEVQRP